MHLLVITVFRYFLLPMDNESLVEKIEKFSLHMPTTIYSLFLDNITSLFVIVF